MMSWNSWKDTVLDSERFTYSYFSLECVCRLCWGTEGVVELTTYSPKSVEKDATIAEKLLECVGIDVTHSQPNKICLSCLEELEIFTEFKKFCLESDRKLRDILEHGSSRISLHTFKVEIEENYVEPMVSVEEVDHELKLLKKEDKLDQLILKQEHVDDFSDFELNDADLNTDDLLIDSYTSYEIGGKVEENNEKRKQFQMQLPIYCFTCHIKLDSNAKLAEHNLEFHGKDKNEFYKCYGCNKRYKNPGVRLRHEVTVCRALKKGYRCQICHKYLLKRKVLELHMRAHKENKTISSENFIKCKQCSEFFQTLEDLRQHTSTHKKSEQFVCEVCGRVFKRRGNLNIHKVVHTGVKSYKCPHCDHRCAQPSSLVVHIRLSENHNCENYNLGVFKSRVNRYLLGKRATPSTAPSLNIRIHTGERPYACDVCPQRCYSSSNLKKHKRSHSSIKEYKCKICGKSFRDNCSLKEHLAAVHEKSKIHACSICDAKYFRFRTLREHLLLKHGQKVKKVKDGVVQVAAGVIYKRKRKGLVVKSNSASSSSISGENQEGG